MSKCKSCTQETGWTHLQQNWDGSRCVRNTYNKSEKVSRTVGETCNGSVTILREIVLHIWTCSKFKWQNCEPLRTKQENWELLWLLSHQWDTGLKPESRLLTCSQSYKIHEAFPSFPFKHSHSQLHSIKVVWVYFKPKGVEESSCFKVLLLPSCVLYGHKDAESFQFLFSAGAMHRYLPYTLLSREVCVSFLYFRHTSCSVCALLS